MIAASMDKWISLAQMVYFHGITNPDSPGLMIADKVYSYGELVKRARLLAAYLKDHHISHLGILAARSLEAYIAVLAASWAGITYIPLNPAFPINRIKKIIEKAQVQAVAIDSAALPLLDLPNAEFFATLPIITPYHYHNTLSLHFQVVKQEKIQESLAREFEPVQPEDADLVYIMFTSGSTGEPKGVPVTAYNLKYFFMAIKQRYSLTSQDKVSQFSELSFDVSVFDMFLAWHAGAALYVIPHALLLGSAHFIRDNQKRFGYRCPAPYRSCIN